MEFNSGSNRARNFKSIWNYLPYYSLNCTPLSPITITNCFNNFLRKTWLTHEKSPLGVLLKIGIKQVNKGYIITIRLQSQAGIFEHNTDSSSILFIAHVFVQVIAWLVVVFGNNTVSDISKLPKIPRAVKWYLENFEISRAGIIAKYYVQVMLLVVYNRSREIFGNAQETFLFIVEKKTNTGVYVVTIFLH